MVPYKDSALLRLLPEMLDLQSRQVLVENTRRYGLSYLDAFVALTNENKDFTSESLRRHIASRNTLNELLPTSSQDRLSSQRMTGVSNNLRKSSPTAWESSSGGGNCVNETTSKQPKASEQRGRTKQRNKDQRKKKRLLRHSSC